MHTEIGKQMNFYKHDHSEENISQGQECVFNIDIYNFYSFPRYYDENSRTINV